MEPVSVTDGAQGPSNAPELEQLSKRDETLTWHDPDTLKESVTLSTLDAIRNANSKPVATAKVEQPVTDDADRIRK